MYIGPVPHVGGVTIIKGGGGFIGVEMSDHGVFNEEFLAFWINEGFDARDMA